MAKIKITSIGYNQSYYTLIVSLTESQTIEGEDIEVSLGEASIRFPSDTEMADIKKKIIDVATDIMKAHKNALDKRHDIEELDFPDIT